MSPLFNMLSRFVIAFLPRSKCLLISWLQSPSAVILETKNIKSVTVSIVSPSICHGVMGPDAMILFFWMLYFKQAFLLSSFTFIKRLLSSSSFFAITVVSSAYLRLLTFHLVILIPACASASQAFLMMYSAAAAAKSLQSCPTLCDPIDSSPPGSLSLGFFRQEHWSGLPFPSPMNESEKWKWSRSVVSNSLWPHGLQPTRLLHPWDFPGKCAGVGCHCLLWMYSAYQVK